jgi:hypothetical protein
VKKGEKTGISSLLLCAKDNYCKHSGDIKNLKNKQSVKVAHISQEGVYIFFL